MQAGCIDRECYSQTAVGSLVIIIIEESIKAQQYLNFQWHYECIDTGSGHRRVSDQCGIRTNIREYMCDCGGG